MKHTMKKLLTSNALHVQNPQEDARHQEIMNELQAQTQHLSNIADLLLRQDPVPKGPSGLPLY